MNYKKFINTHEDSISNYLKDVRKSEIVDVNKEIELAIKIKDGDDNALNELVNANLRFVISIAKEYQNQGLPLADLISEGNYGLITAAKRFDHTKGFRFISYAVWWIKQSIIQSLNENARMVRLPANVIVKLSKLKKEFDEFEKKFERKPLDNDEIEVIFYPTVTSYNEYINEDGDELLDIIENPNTDRPDYDPNEEYDVKNQLNKILSKLTEREKSIIEMYYGLNGSPMTLEEIGEEFNLTKERVRQIKVRILRFLRSESIEIKNQIFS